MKLVDKRLVKDNLRVVTVDRERSPSPGFGGFGGLAANGPLLVGEDIPLTVDVKDFQYDYKCKHCGHVWSEKHEADQRL